MTRFTVRVVLIAAGSAVLASPAWLRPGDISAFPVVSVVFTLVVATLKEIVWRSTDGVAIRTIGLTDWL